MLEHGIAEDGVERCVTKAVMPPKVMSVALLNLESLNRGRFCEVHANAPTRTRQGGQAEERVLGWHRSDLQDVAAAAASAADAVEQGKDVGMHGVSTSGNARGRSELDARGRV
jgi:hypothetical protein